MMGFDPRIELSYVAKQRKKDLKEDSEKKTLVTEIIMVDLGVSQYTDKSLEETHHSLKEMI